MEDPHGFFYHHPSSYWFLLSVDPVFAHARNARDLLTLRTLYLDVVVATLGTATTSPLYEDGTLPRVEVDRLRLASAYFVCVRRLIVVERTLRESRPELAAFDDPDAQRLFLS